MRRTALGSLQPVNMSPVEELNQLRQRALLTVSDLLKESHVTASDDLETEGPGGLRRIPPSFSKITVGATLLLLPGGCKTTALVCRASLFSLVLYFWFLFLSFFFFFFTGDRGDPSVSGMECLQVCLRLSDL